MLNYIYGKIIYTAKTFVIIDNNGMGYKLRTPNSEGFVVGQFVRIYTVQINKIDQRSNLTQELFGFVNSIERQLFADLLAIHGVGSTIATNIVQSGYENVIKAIINQNTDELRKIKAVSEKCAMLISSSLYTKYKKYVDVYTPDENSKNLDDLVLVLQELGYTSNDIDLAIKSCDGKSPLEDMIKQSIQIIAETHTYVKP